MKTLFDLTRLEAVKVQFKQPIFEDDFPDKGMKAWLTDIVVCVDEGHYKLFFDFSEFEAENEKYFKEDYWPNIHTAKLEVKKERYTAKEAGYYNPKYYVYFGDTKLTQEENDKELSKYLKLIEG